MAKALPFGAAWEKVVLYLGPLGNALGEKQFSAAHLFNVVVALAVGGATIAIGQVFYNIYLHPLRKFPGPLLARGTSFWRFRRLIAGNLAFCVKKLHEEYGPVVRIAPYELAFIDSQAWKDIYGYHGSYEMAKDDRFYRQMGKGIPDTLISADRPMHSMLRRQLAPGFSERAMRAQESIFREYVDLLMKRLDEHSDGGKNALDMKAWFNYTTFDVIGNLSFGSDFGCLENSRAHPWVEAITSNLKEGAFMRGLIMYISPTWIFLMDKLGLLPARKKHMGYTKETLQRRLDMQDERPDFIQGLLKKSDELSFADLEMNASLLVIAGSETTASLLSGAFYLLGMNRDALDKVVQEVRYAFNSEEEIDLISVNRLDYMLACLKESLRQYPPVTHGMPRVVPKGGHDIAGHWVPENTSVSVWQIASNYSTRNFTKPEEFRPERFLGDPEFAQDDFKAMQPFSIGPRNCIGTNLAYAEMRLICARILYKFDIELAPEAKDWLKVQKAYSVWDKPALPIYLKPAATTAA